MRRELLVLRHAKSAWDSDAPTDFQRPLAERGRKDAPKMGRWMLQTGLKPDSVLSSPALRAWQTAVAVGRELGIAEEQIDFDKRLYLADGRSLLAVLVHTPAEIERLLLIGHNPGLEELMRHLVRDGIPSREDAKLLPTAALAQIQISAPWSDLGQGVGSLVRLIRPREV